MKRSNRLVILVGVLLAVLAFVGIVVLLQGRGTTGPPVATTVAVLVAKQDIAIGDPINPDMVEVRQVDPSAVIGTRFSEPSQLIGRPALYPVPAGAQVPQQVIAGGVGTTCIACQLLPGERAIAFQVDRITGLDFLVQKGDHIDIVYRTTIQVLQPSVDSTDEFPRFEAVPGLEAAPTVKVLLQDKRVLYVSATRIQSAAQGAPTPSPTQGGAAAAPIETVVIVFAGTDADAEVIKFAQTDQSVIGPLTAILRATDDTVIEVTEGATLQLLVERFGIPIPLFIQVEIPTPSP
ncbi:MAG TPA: Flp pilus assembly protein CpaB [Candidatus Limnocylindria bacterium]|nr:Flp pilus assembly protein CpaB [Candidatus Limnocylindria bacterium]